MPSEAFGEPGTSAKLPIGMNLSAVSDWELGFPFRNLMWGARIWGTMDLGVDGPWDTGVSSELELDENGYPLELPFQVPQRKARQCAYAVLPNTLKPGRYVVLYDGEGLIGGKGSTLVLESKPGRLLIGMKHDSALPEGLAIRRSVRGNHVRNIRVLALDDEFADLAANPFRDDFVAFCRPWHCLRFMDWLQTNNSIVRSWDRRKTPSFYTQIGVTGDVPAWQHRWASGVALELCIKLANKVRSDIWVCVPHMADDDYIAAMARLLRDTVDPSLKVYLEYSNELWNWGSQQAYWELNGALAGDLVAAAGAPQPWKARVRPTRFVDGTVAPGAGEGIDHPERIGALFRRTFKIWEDVFAGEARRRLVRVCSVQAAWTDATERTLAWVMRGGGCDVLSPAGYFGPDEAVYKAWAAKGPALNADDVIADMAGVIAKEAGQIAVNAAIAKRAGVGIVAYEGGQHIQPEGQVDRPYGTALERAQRHPQMYDLYRRLLSLHQSQGFSLFCAFSSITHQGSRYGSWGHVERYGQDPSEMPKYRALLDANTARP